MNPLLIKLVIALAPSIEQLIASILNYWSTKKKTVDAEKVAAKVIKSAEVFAAVVTSPIELAPQKEALAAWAKAQPTPESFKKLE